MVIKNFVLEALSRNEILNNLIKSRELPVKTSFQIAKLTKALDEQFKFYSEAKQRIIEKHCLRDENGKPKVENNQYSVPPENIPLFNIELMELLDIDIELGMDKIKIKLDSLPEGVLAPADFPFLENFIEFEE